MKQYTCPKQLAEVRTPSYDNEALKEMVPGGYANPKKAFQNMPSCSCALYCL